MTALEAYFKRLKAVPLLSPAEVRGLYSAMDDIRGRLAGAGAGERAALETELLTLRNRMASANLRLVVSVAKRFANCGLPPDDLIAEGNIGLLAAIDRFDPSRGVNFASYAVWWIRQSMYAAVHDNGRTIRIPRNVFARTSRSRTAGEELAARLGRKPSAAELADCLGVPTDRALDAVRLPPLTVSLDVATSEGDAPPSETVADASVPDPSEAVVSSAVREAVREAVARLPMREREVLTLRFGLRDGFRRTLAEVSWLLGVTGERVAQIEKKALKRLRLLAALREFAGEATISKMETVADDLSATELEPFPRDCGTQEQFQEAFG